MIPAIAFVANAITRDFDVRTSKLLYATGVRPAPFVLERCIGGTVFAMLTGFAASLGTLGGTLAPWLDPECIGEFTLGLYAFTSLMLILPNYFLVFAIFSRSWLCSDRWPQLTPLPSSSSSGTLY